MEAFTTILGIIMIYSWIHSLIIIIKNLGEIQFYEKLIVLFGLTFLILFFIGITSNL